MKSQSVQRSRFPVRFHFHEGKSVPAQGSELEAIVAPLALARSAPPPSLSGPRWSSEEIQKQYAKRLKDLPAPPPTSGDPYAPPAKSIAVTVSTGGVSSFLFVDPAIRSFDLHGEMLKAFGEPLKAAEGRVILDVRMLDGDLQLRVLHAFAFLSVTIGWECTRFGQCALSKKSDSAKAGLLELHVSSGFPESEVREIAERALRLGQANNQVRTLAELPANELNPANYRQKVREFAAENGLEFEFWDRKELLKRKAGAFLAVTQADPDTASGIAYVRYVPAGVKRTSKAGKKGGSAKSSTGTKVLSLVGKGICFDTGGYNVKPADGMLGMHGDMTGSALALALCGYFAQIGADFEVRAYLAIAENLISPTAYKPNEVVIASDGTSIEVVDTDAEGRMVLADTLAFARQGKPDLLIDYATLTGAAIRSLDRRKSAVFSRREELAQTAVRCGESSGERVWYFPLDADYRRALKSRVADILQCSENNNADHIYAATFLSHFAGAETPWIHMDLVACENKGGLGLIATDTTGFGTLWTDAFVREILG